MTHTKRMVGTFVAKKQDRHQRTNQLHNWGLSMMPPFASSLGLFVALCLIQVHFGNFFICPHFILISYDKVMPTRFWPISDMVKNPFPSTEILQTNRTEQKVAKIIFPNGLYLMDFKRMSCKLLFGGCQKRASLYKTCKGGRLLGRAGARGRTIVIGISKFRKLFTCPLKCLLLSLI